MNSSLNTNLGQINIPSKFKRIDFPEMDSDHWYFLNHSNLEYFVENHNNKLEVSIINFFNDFEYNLSDGKLIGTSYPGEGEMFYFQPTDKSLKEIEIKKGNVLFVFDFKNHLYFIESIDHDECQKGILFKLEKVGNKFKYQEILEIQDTPLAFLMHFDTLYIATNSSFILINKFMQTIIIEDAIWNSLYPNSIAYFNEENIFLGLRAGIVRLDLKRLTTDYFESEEN